MVLGYWLVLGFVATIALLLYWYGRRLWRAVKGLYQKSIAKIKQIRLAKLFTEHMVSVASFVCAVACIWALYVTSPFDELNELGLTERATNVRNILLSFAALVGVPFLVWRSKLSFEANQQKQRTLENDIYIKAVEQLASEKETLRLAACHTFVQLLQSSKDQSFKIKICEMLRTFMRETSSRKYMSSANLAGARQELSAEEQTRLKPYQSQYLILIEALARVNRQENFFIKGIENVVFFDLHLYGINISSLNIEGCIFIKCKFDKILAKEIFFSESYFEDVMFNSCNLTYSHFSNCHFYLSNEGAFLGIWYTDITRSSFEGLTQIIGGELTICKSIVIGTEFSDMYLDGRTDQGLLIVNSVCNTKTYDRFQGSDIPNIEYKIYCEDLLDISAENNQIAVQLKDEILYQINK